MLASCSCIESVGGVMDHLLQCSLVTLSFW